MNEEEYLSRRLDDQINWYSQKSSDAQKMYKCLKNAEFFFAGSIPILLLLWPDNYCSKIAVAIIGAIIAFSNAHQSLHKYHENWIEYRSTSEMLKHEKYMYLTRSGIYECDDAFKILAERAETIISHENINWANTSKCTESGK